MTRAPAIRRIEREFAGILLELGAWQRAKAHLDRGVELARSAGHRLVQAECHLGVARAYDGLGDTFAADAEFAAAEALSPWRSEPAKTMDCQHARSALLLEAAKAAHRLRRGELELAAQLASRVLDLAARGGSREQRALAHDLMARVELGRGDIVRAQAAVEAGLALLTEEGSPLVRWRLFATLAIERDRAGQPNAAHEALRQARALIDRLALGIDDAELRAGWLSSPEVALVLAKTDPSATSD